MAGLQNTSSPPGGSQDPIAPGRFSGLFSQGSKTPIAREQQMARKRLRAAARQRPGPRCSKSTVSAGLDGAGVSSLWGYSPSVPEPASAVPEKGGSLQSRDDGAPLSSASRRGSLAGASGGTSSAGEHARGGECRPSAREDPPLSAPLSPDSGEEILLSPPRRGRGRPATTGLGVGIRERKEEEERKRRERARILLEREVVTEVQRSLVEVARGGKGDPARMVPERYLPEAVGAMTGADLASGASQCLGAIALVAKKSGSLQGKLQGALNRAVDNISLVLSTMLVRLREQEGGPPPL